jgi:pyruvate dehydrogenase E1 component beta subunit
MKGDVPDENDYIVPLGKANVLKEGKDMSIIAHGKAVHSSLQVAQTLEEKHGIFAEVLDLRSIRPLDVDAIIATVKKTNRVLLVEENKPFCGVDSQVAFIIQDQAFDFLDAPIKRISAIDAPQAYSKALENIQIPDHDRILAKAMELV